MAKRSREGDILIRQENTGIKRSFEAVIIGPRAKRAREHEYWHHAMLTREERAKQMNIIYTRLIQQNA